MSRGPDLFLTVRGRLLLLRGFEADTCAHAIACHAIRNPGHCRHTDDYPGGYCVPRWSDAGRGYVLPSCHLGDAAAWAHANRLLAVVSDVSKRVKESA